MKYLEKELAKQVTDKNVSKANFLQLSLSHVSENSACSLAVSHVNEQDKELGKTGMITLFLFK